MAQEKAEQCSNGDGTGGIGTGRRQDQQLWCILYPILLPRPDLHWCWSKFTPCSYWDKCPFALRRCPAAQNLSRDAAKPGLAWLPHCTGMYVGLGCESIGFAWYWSWTKYHVWFCVFYDCRQLHLGQPFAVFSKQFANAQSNVCNL